MNFLLKPPVLFILYFALTCFHTSGQKADLILFNGKIFTAEDEQTFVTALAIKGNKILATGPDANVLKLATPKTKRIDLKGKVVVPGFNDQHDHAAFEKSPAPHTYNYNEINFQGPTKAGVLDSIRNLLSKAKPGEWIAGMIGTFVFHDTSMRRSLDSIAPNNPVALQIWWGHGIVTNKRGLEAAGLSDDMADPVGGWYERNSEGKIAAVQQNAQLPFWQAIDQAYPETVVKLMEVYGREQLKGGITSTLFFGSSFTYLLINRILKQASIPQRLRIVAWPRSTPAGRQVSEWPLAATNPTPASTISGIKYVIDGTPGEGNALRSKPYHNRGNGNGRLNYPTDTLRQIFREALTTRRQLMMHITADSSFGIVLNLMKEVGNADQWRPLRVRIEHNTVGNPTKEQRMLLRDYGILMMHTPKYGTDSPVRSLMEDSILVGISPDGTVNPFFEIFMVTTRQSDPSENITVPQAVIAFTKMNAYAEFSEKEKGMLKKGMVADLAILSQDIFTIPAQQLMATESILTIIDGKVRYEKK
jgi:hypothetical protein